MSSKAKAKTDKSKAKGEGNGEKKGGGSSAVCSQCGRSDCPNPQPSSSSNPTACKPPEQWTNKETNQMRDIHNENRQREQERKDKIAEEEAKRNVKEAGKNSVFGNYSKSGKGSSNTQPSVKQQVINANFSGVKTDSIPQPPSISKKNKAEKGTKNDVLTKKKASSTKKLEKEAKDAEVAKEAGDAKKAKDAEEAKKAEASNHEIFLLQSIVHPHVIRLYSFCSTPEAIHMIMDFCKYGDMYSLIMKQKQKNLSFTESALLVFTLQIISGLDFIHSKSIIHRDLKPENVLIQDEYHLKLADFGATKSLSMGARAGTTVGTRGYMAPEIASQNYTYLEDSYALGATLYNMVTFDFGSTSFSLQNYKLQDFEKMTRELQGYLQKFSPIILRLLALTEAKRMSVFEARVELRKIYTCSELKKHLNSLQMDPDTRDADKKFFEETIIPIKIDPDEVCVCNFGDVITLKITNSSPQKYVWSSTVTNKHCYTLRHQYGNLEAFGTAAFVLERQNNPCLDKDVLSNFLKEYKEDQEIIPKLGYRNSKGQEHVLQVNLIVLPY